MSRRYPTELEAIDSMNKLTAMMVHNARRRDRFRAAFEGLTDGEKIGMICELIEVDEGEFLDWLIERHKSQVDAEEVERVTETTPKETTP